MAPYVSEVNLSRSINKNFTEAPSTNRLAFYFIVLINNSLNLKFIDMKTVFFSILFALSLQWLSAQDDYQKGTYYFDHIRLNTGPIMTQYDNPTLHQNPGYGLGFSGEATLADAYFLGTSFDFNFGNMKFVDITMDLGAGASAYMAEDVDLFLGLCLLSMNLNVYDQSPFNSAIFLKLRYKKLFYESKMTVWGWQQGKDPVFRMNSYYGVAYKISEDFAVNLTYKLYSPEAKFLHLGIGWLL